MSDKTIDRKGKIGTCVWEVGDIDGRTVLTISPEDGISGEYDSLTNAKKDLLTEKMRPLWPWEDCKQTVEAVEIKGDISIIGSTREMFCGFESLKEISGLEGLDTGRAADAAYMFGSCISLEKAPDLAKLDFSNITMMHAIFLDCPSLKDISGIAGLDMGRAADVSWMFGACTSLEDISPLAGLDFGSVTDLGGLFKDCTSLKDISPLAGLDFGSVRTVEDMFHGCTSLEDISPLAGLDFGSVRTVKDMFNGCSSLNDISILAGLGFGNVEVFDDMFKGCTSLTDISPIAKMDTGSARSMSGMFSGCSSVTDLSPAVAMNTENVKSFSCLFKDCNPANLPPAYLIYDENRGSVKLMITEDLLTINTYRKTTNADIMSEIFGMPARNFQKFDMSWEFYEFGENWDYAYPIPALPAVSPPGYHLSKEDYKNIKGYVDAFFRKEQAMNGRRIADIPAYMEAVKDMAASLCRIHTSIGRTEERTEADRTERKDAGPAL